MRRGNINRLEDLLDKRHADMNMHWVRNIIGLDKIVNIYLSMSLNICFGCSKESSQVDDSFEYPQQMFWLRNK